MCKLLDICLFCYTYIYVYIYSLCRGCRHPNSREDIQLSTEYYKEGVYCRYCVNVLTDEQKLANLERHNQMMLAEQRNEIHLGRPV